VELPIDTEDEEFEINANKPPRPVYTAKFAQGRYTSGVEALINDDQAAPPRRKSSYPGHVSGGGLHRSRDRTRQSAVQRLVERKLAQKEKEREKERDRSLGSISSSRFDSFLSSRHSTHSYSPTRAREASSSRSENGFILGAGRCSSPSKENVEPDWVGPRRRSARSVSATRLRGSAEEPGVKTYITIGPGKPTRIREHSPAKSAKLSPDETVTTARERFARGASPFRNIDLNRQSSPSPIRKNSRTVSPPTKSKDILRDASPLKSTDILKSFRAFSESKLNRNSPDENQNTEPYFSEKVFRVNQSKIPSYTSTTTSRRLSVDILNNINSSGFNKPADKRASPDSDTSTSSSPLSSLSGSTDSVESDKSVLSQRRISLEQRFQARARFTSPERSSTHTYTQASGVEASTKVDDTWTHIKIRRYSTVKTHHEFTSVSGGQTSSSPRPIPASRKISLPQAAGKRPEPAPRRRSLTTILSSERLGDERKEEGNQLYKLKNYREALLKYTEAIDLCPQCAAFYGNRSACYLMLGQPKQALQDAKTATTVDPTFCKGWSRVAKCSLLLGDTVTARQALQNAGTDGDAELRNIDTLDRFKGEANTAFNNKDYRKSLFCLDKCLGIATHCLTLKTSRAECLAFLGRYAEAQEAANGVLSLDNLNADAIYVRGLCLYYEDNLDRAISHFTQVLRFAPDHVKAKEMYKKAKALKLKKEEGNTVFKAGQLDEAYKLYSEALNIDPSNKNTNSKLYFNRATVLGRQKKLDLSIADCNKAIELDNSYIKAYLRRAKSYTETEQYEEAVRDYETIFKTDKSNREYRHLLQEAKNELRKSKRKDYYKILGVEKSANDDEVKKAYRKRAMVHHPDRHSSASDEEKKDHEHKFKEVGEAYAVLSDDKKRRMYDSGQDLEDGGCGGHGYQDIDPNSIFQAFFQGGMGGGGGGGGQHFSFGGQQHAGPQNFSFQFG